MDFSYVDEEKELLFKCKDIWTTFKSLQGEVGVAKIRKHCNGTLN